MKYKREGTLEHFSYSTKDGDDMREAAREMAELGIAGISDFCTKADTLAVEILDRHKLPTDWPTEIDDHNAVYPDEFFGQALSQYAIEVRTAVKMKLEVRRLKAHLQSPLPKQLDEAVYCAIGAALCYANLRNEQRDDKMSRGKINRAAYFKAKANSTTRAGLADSLGVSLQGLSKWEDKNIE